MAVSRAEIEVSEHLVPFLCLPLRLGLMAKMMPQDGEKKEAAGFDVSAMGDGLMQMMGGFTLLRLSGMMGMMGYNPTKEDLLGLNAMLNQIKKPE